MVESPEGRNRNSYRTMSTQIEVLVVDNRLVLEETHNSPTAPHALAIESLGPVFLDHIQCQRRLRPAKKQCFRVCELHDFMGWKSPYLFDVNIWILQFQMQHVDSELLEDLQRTSQTAHLIVQREYDRCFVAWRYFFRRNFRPLLTLEVIRCKKRQTKKMDNVSFLFLHRLITSDSVLLLLPNVRRAYAMGCLPSLPIPVRHCDTATIPIVLFPIHSFSPFLFSFASAFLLFTLFLALLSHSMTVVYASQWLVWSVFCICILSFDSLWLTLVFIFTQVGWLHLTILILATEYFVLRFFFHFLIRWLNANAFNVQADCEWDGRMVRENKEW